MLSVLSFAGLSLLLSTNPPIAKPGRSADELIADNMGWNNLVEREFTTNSPSLNIAGIESDVSDPGPLTNPPTANLIGDADTFIADGLSAGPDGVVCKLPPPPPGEFGTWTATIFFTVAIPDATAAPAAIAANAGPITGIPTNALYADTADA